MNRIKDYIFHCLCIEGYSDQTIYTFHHSNIEYSENYNTVIFNNKFNYYTNFVFVTTCDDLFLMQY